MTKKEGSKAGSSVLLLKVLFDSEWMDVSSDRIPGTSSKGSRDLLRLLLDMDTLSNGSSGSDGSMDLDRRLLLTKDAVPVRPLSILDGLTTFFDLCVFGDDDDGDLWRREWLLELSFLENVRVLW